MTKQYTPQNSQLSIVNRPDASVPVLIPRYTLRLVPGKRPATPLLIIRDSGTAARVLRPFFAGLDREQFLIACLDAKHAIIGVNIVSIRSLTLSIVHPREVFKAAILLNSPAIICRVRMRSFDRILPQEPDVMVSSHPAQAVAKPGSHAEPDDHDGDNGGCR